MNTISMKRFYLSKNYKDPSIAGNKAKTDVEKIMADMGFKNAGLAQTTYNNSILGFFITIIGALKVFFTVSKGDILVLQYPLKKYYSFVCKTAHLKGCRVITLVHDLGSFRRKKLSVAKEIRRLSLTDYLIVHNSSMKEWLLENGYKRPKGCLEIFDYLSETKAPDQAIPSHPYTVVYAGGLAHKKNPFLYDMNDLPHTWHFNLYGRGFEWERIQNRGFYSYKGFIPSDQLISQVEGDFGLVWDGESITTCSGSFGEYLRFNNPHKMSLYIRCNIPVIIWEKAALSPFVKEHNIGVCVESLTELEDTLKNIDAEKYMQMKQNIRKLSQQLSSGYYFTNAYYEAEKCILK